MHRDRQPDARVNPDHHRARDEWDIDRGERHPMEPRTHARQPGRTHRAFDQRDAEAERQIRELRARY